MRLIDADALKENLENSYGSEANMTHEANLFRDMIEDQPTAYDVDAETKENTSQIAKDAEVMQKNSSL